MRPPSRCAGRHYFGFQRWPTSIGAAVHRCILPDVPRPRLRPRDDDRQPRATTTLTVPGAAPRDQAYREVLRQLWDISGKRRSMRALHRLAGAGERRLCAALDRLRERAGGMFRDAAAGDPDKLLRMQTPLTSGRAGDSPVGQLHAEGSLLARRAAIRLAVGRGAPGREGRPCAVRDRARARHPRSRAPRPPRAAPGEASRSGRRA